MIELAYRDARHSVSAVRLAPALAMEPVPFLRNGATWTVRFDRPPVRRLEYLLEIAHRDGRVERICDPANPLRAPGPFGEKSVLELPGYSPPRM